MQLTRAVCPVSSPSRAIVRGFGLALLLCCSVVAAAGDWRGSIGLEYRLFPEAPAFPGQHNGYASVWAEPEWNYQRADGKLSFTFVPFARVDQYDERRTHWDIRELNGLWVGGDWELRIGIGKVFWGVTESQHLVDIVNQTDLVERPDGERKLGQPMIDLTLVRDWGTLDFFILPGFRERTFPGQEGRLRSGIVVDTDNPQFESGAAEKHVDFALRWAHYVGIWDIGLSHFHGTSREPQLIPEIDSDRARLIPFYPQIDQTGIDVQATYNSWLFKLEAIRRSGFGDTFVAATAGFEYTLYGIFDSPADLGLLAEYNYDDRDDLSVPFGNDVFGGIRITLNDVQSSTLLAGCFVDVEDDGRLCRLEGSRRLTDNWFVSLEGAVFSDLSPNSVLFSLRQDDYIELTFEYSF